MKGHPIKVLLFEDNPGDIRLLQEFLRVDKNDPYELIVEGNLRKGLLRLPKEIPDVILLDLGLPDSQGMDTFSKVHLQAADVPIVILTGLTETEIAVEAVKAGAQDYLVKGEVNDSLLRRSLRYAIERKRGEEQLRESEESFHSLVENAPIGIYRTTPDGRITMINPTLLSVLGYKSFDELAQRDLSKEGYEPEYPRHDFQELMKKKGEIIGLESAWKRKDGSTIFVRESARLVRDENHRPLYYEGTVEDITERKLAEVKLKSVSNRQEAILAAIPDILMEVNNNKVYTWANPAGLAFFGEDVVGKEAANYFEGEQDTYTIMQPLFNGSENVISVESWQRRKDGEKRLLAWLCRTIKDQDGNVTGALSSALDITDRKLMEDKLGEERILLRTLIDNLPDRVYAMDVQGRKILSNVADWQASGGKRMEDVIGKTDLDTYPPELAKEYWALDKAVIESGIPIINHEEPGLDPQGEPVRILSSKVPLRDHLGNVVGLVGIGHDITEQKKIEEQIEVLSRIPDESPNPILRVTKQGILLYSNPSSALLLTLWNTQIGQGLPDEWRERVKKVFTSGHYQEIEVRAGEKIFSLILAPIIGESYVNLYGRDVTLRKLAEETLVHQNEEIQKRNMELDRLYQASGSLLSSTPFNLKGLATTIVDVVLKEFGQANCSLFVIQKDSNELIRLASGGSYVDQVKDKQVTLDGPGLVPQVISTGKLMNVIDIHTIPGFVPNWEAAQSELTIPLKVENHVIGVIDIQSSERGAFSSGDERLMSIFAERAALVLERGRLDGELERRLQQLSSLRSIDMAITSSMDINITMQILLENLIQNLGIHAADILIFDPVMQTFRFTAGLGFRTQALQHTNLHLGDGYAGQAARDRQIITIRDLLRNTGGLQRSAELHSEGFVSYVGAPLIAKGQVKGVLEIFQRETFELDQEKRTFLEMLAGQAAIAIDSSQLFENLQSSNSELMMAYDETIEGWSRAMDLRDEETEGHSRRVTELTLRLANIMMIKPEELLQIRRGALLHDIGKIGIPDTILRKPGPLTDEEWVIMRRHPQLAHDLLAPIMYLRLAVDIPWCHHEKWDGTGYPRGLKGDEIPLAARIFAVVDVWDALCSDRPYRKAWPVDKVRTYIQEQAGKYFDPRIVESFLKEVSRVE